MFRIVLFVVFCFLHLITYIWSHSMSIHGVLPYSFLQLPSTLFYGWFTQSVPSRWYMILFLSFAITNNVTVDDSVCTSFFFSITVVWVPTKSITVLSNTCVYNFAKYFQIPLGESLGIGPFCIPTIKVWTNLFLQSHKQYMLKTE